MRTQERAGTLDPSGSSSTPTRRPFSVWLREHLPGLVAVCVAGGLIAAFFLTLYWVKHYTMPIGWDTPRYLDQTNLVAAHGLTGVPNELPPPTKTLPSRGAFPIVMLTLSSLFGTSTFSMATVVPPAAAAAVALAAGALLAWTLRRGPWEMAAASVLIGTSLVVIRLVAPETYTDNLFGAAILVAAMIPVIATVRDGRGFVGGILLLAAGGLAHGPSFAVVVLALGLVAVVLLPASWRSWRSGETRLLATPSARMAGLVAGGAALGAAVTYGVLHAPPDTPKLTRGELTKKLHEDLPLYRYWLTVPLAALGVWDLARTGSRRTGADERVRTSARLLLLILLAWTLVTMAGVALFALGRSSPAHRFLSFLLPLPILGAAGVLFVGRAVGARTSRAAGARTSRAVGVGLVSVAILGVGFLGYRTLYVDLAQGRGVEWIDPGKIQDAATAASYLDAARIPADAPVVFVIDDAGPNPLSYVPEMTYMLRSVLPADRIPHAYVYVGNPEKYLAGQPTYRTHPKTYDANADRFWPTIQALLPQHPVALLLSSYNELYAPVAARHADWVVGPNVIVLNGPRPAAPVSAPPIPTAPRTVAKGATLGAGTLVVLALIGLGWAIALLPRGMRPEQVLALAPAFGIAFLILAGIVVDAVGLRLVGRSGGLTPVLAGVAGAVAALGRARAWRESEQHPAATHAGTGAA